MLQQKSKKLTGFFLRIDKFIALLLLLFLASCGDGCYDDANIGGQSQSYYTKTLVQTIPAKQNAISGVLHSEAAWTNTGIILSSTNNNTSFVVQNVSGTASCMTNPNAPNNCAIPYATMCQNGQKSVCTDATLSSTVGACNNFAPVNPCNGNSTTCSQNLCPSSGTQLCWNGALYQYVCQDSSGNSCDCSNQGPNCTQQLVNMQQPCSESVSCQNGQTYISFPYVTTDSSGNQTYNTDKVAFGTCTASDLSCANGNPYPVSAINSNTASNPIGTWTQIDTNILPGDDIYLQILPPTIGAVTLPAPPASSSPSLNAWSLANSLVYPQSQYPSYYANSLCPTQIPLQVATSNYTQCPFLNNGYYTCPLCDGSGRTRSITSPAVPKACDGSGIPLQCWNVGGSGMWLKIIDSTANCSTDQQSCINGGTNCIWFDQYVGNNNLTDSNFGIITYQPVTSDGINCGTNGDFSYCDNRLTKRHMTGANGGLTQICALIPWTEPSSVGGYTVYATRQACVGYNGLSSAAAPFINEIPPYNAPGAGINQVMALEYILSPNTPSTSTYGTVMLPANPTYPLTINVNLPEGVTSGTLYLRIRDNYQLYGDNTGSYTVNLQYTQYLTGGVISLLVEDVKNMLYNMIYNASLQYFNNITCIGSCECEAGGNCSSQYPGYIRALLVLYIAGYGLAFLIGLVEISQKDLIVRVLKIGLVLTLISPNSFNFFYKDFFALFFNGMDELIRDSQAGFANSSASPNTATFAFADNMISLTLFSSTTWLKLLALAFVSPLGLILAAMLIIGVLLFLVGIFKAIVVYLMAVLVLGILILLAPIFIPFCLFKTTNYLFENWIKMFVQYTLEPVMLLIGLGVLTELAYVLLTQIINFHVCWKCMWPINFAFLPSVTKALSLSETIFCLQFFGPFGMMPTGGGALMSAMGLEVVDILLFVIIGHLIMGYDKLVSQIIKRITGAAGGGGFKGNDGGSVGSAVFNRTGIPKLAGSYVDKFKSKIKRAAVNAIKKPDEDHLMNQAKATESAYQQNLASNSRALSDGFAASTSSNGGADLSTLANQGSSAQAQAAAARGLGSGLYSAMGGNSNYQNFIGNLSKLSSIEEGSEAYNKLSPEAKALRQDLAQDNISKSLKTMLDKNAGDKEKSDATAELSELLHKRQSDSHKLLFRPDVAEKRAKLIAEVNGLERVPPQAMRKAVTSGKKND